MDTIQFIDKESEFFEGQDAVEIIVNDRNLREILKEYEAPFAEKEGHPEIAGGYAEMGAVQLHANLSNSKDHVSIYVCNGCGEEGCWPMVITVEETEDTVTWRNFRQPHRGEKSKSSYWDYSSFKSFF